MDPTVAAKLAKCCELLNSPHDGEVLAAANRANEIIKDDDRGRLTMTILDQEASR